MSTYTVNPTTHEVLKDGVPVSGSPFSTARSAIQVVNDLGANGDTATLLAGVHVLEEPLQPGTLLNIVTPDGTFEKYAMEPQHLFHQLNWNKGITWQGEKDSNGNLLTTLQGMSDVLWASYASDNLAADGDGLFGPGGIHRTSIMVNSADRSGAGKPTLQDMKLTKFQWGAIEFWGPMDVKRCEFYLVGAPFQMFLNSKLIFPYLEKVNDVWNYDFSSPNYWYIENNKFEKFYQHWHGAGCSGLRYSNNNMNGYLGGNAYPPPETGISWEDVCSGLMYINGWDWDLTWADFAFPSSLGKNTTTFAVDNILTNNVFSGKYSDGTQGKSSETVLVFEAGLGGYSDKCIFKDNRVEDINTFFLVCDSSAWGGGVNKGAKFINNTFARVTSPIYIESYNAVNSGTVVVDNTFEHYDQRPAQNHPFFGTTGHDIAIAVVGSNKPKNFVITHNDYKNGGFSKVVDGPDFVGFVDGEFGLILEVSSSFTNGTVQDYFLVTDEALQTCVVLPGNTGASPSGVQHPYNGSNRVVVRYGFNKKISDLL